MNNFKKRILSFTVAFLFLLSSFSNISSIVAKAEQPDLSKVKQELIESIKKQNNENASKIQASSKLAKQLTNAKEDDTKQINSVDPNEVIRVIVQLDAKPAIEGDAKGISSSNPIDNKTVTGAIKKIENSQATVISKVESITGKKVRKTYGYLVNGFSIEAKRSDISKLSAISGVKCVTESKTYHPDMKYSDTLTQAYSTWQDLGYKGEGMVVSIIDTGIDYSHKDLTLTDPSKSKITSTTPKGPGKFYSVKVPYGYNFADGTDDVVDKNPKTEMHGMHVAGIVAANGKESGIDTFSTVRGVAPEAQLLAMKVFSNNTATKSAYDDDIIAAIEDSVLHGADIINMSLGSDSGFQDANDPTQIAIKNATDNGTVVVISAGNSGTSAESSSSSVPPTNFLGTTDTATVGSPGTAKDAITVAAYENTNITGSALDYNTSSEAGLMIYSKSEIDPMAALTDKAGYELVDCGVGKNTIEKTGDDFSGKDLSGKIALVQKVSGTFGNKKLAAQAAGAIGVIFYNAKGDDSIPTTAAKDGVTIPCINVSYSSGAKLQSLIANGVKVSFNGKSTSVANPNSGDMAAFTSWGPTPELDFKPEISAPGGNIWSLANNNKYQSMSGTSMASPNVAGSEALIVQAIKKDNPGISGRALVELAKDTTVNTAKVEYDKYNNQVPYSPRRQGAGLIQIEDAIKNKVTVTDKNGNSAVALKQIGQATSFDLTLTNYGKDAYTYDLADTGALTEVTNSDTNVVTEALISGATVKYSENSVTVPAGGTAKVTVTITLPNSFAKQNYVEGFIKFNSKTVPSLVVPYIGFYGDWSALQTVDKPGYDSSSLTGMTCLGTGSSTYFTAYGLDNKGVINPSEVAFSQGDLGLSHSVTPNLYMLRNAKNLQVQVLDKDKNILRTLSSENNVKKNLLEESIGAILSGYITGTVDKQGTWDGTLYNAETGKYEAAPDGQYYIRIQTIEDIDNSTVQTVDMPVKIDSNAPSINIASSDESASETYKLQWKVSDDATGATGQFAIAVNGNLLSEDELSKIVLNGDTYSIDLTLDKNSENQIVIMGTDYASNLGFNVINVKTGTLPEVYFLNLQNDEQISTDSITVIGKVQPDVKKLTINKSDVTINDNGTFEQELSLVDGANTINVIANSSDKEVFNTSYTVYSNTQKPVIDITSTSPEVSKDGYIYTDQHSVAINGKVQVNENAKATATLLVNGDEIKLNPDGTFSTNVAVQGNTLVQMIAVDSYGNTSEKDLTVIASVNSDPFAIKFDNLVAFSTLSGKDISNDTYTITGSLNHKVPVFKIAGQNVIIKDDLTFSTDVKLSQGNNTINVYAEDNNETIVYNCSYKVLYDSVSPKLTISSPVAKADGKIYTNQDSLTIEGLVNDNTYGYSLYVNGNAVLSYDRYPATGDSPDKKFSYTVPLTADNNIIKVDLIDEFNNTTEDVLNVVKDKIAPKAAKLTADNSNLTNKDVNVTITPDSSDKDIDKVEYSFDGNTYLPYASPVKVVSNGKVYARVTDYAGNTAVSSIEVSNIDKTAPIVTVSGVEDGKTYINTTVTPKVTTDKPATTTFQLDGKNYDGTTAISGLGNHELIVKATDAAGNETVKDMKFTIAAQTVADQSSLTNYLSTLLGQAKPGDKITIDSTSYPIISSSIFATLKGNNVFASFNANSALGAITWIFNGSDVTDTAKDVDLSLNAVTPSADSIKKLDGNAQIFSFKYEGNLPGKAVVSLPVDASKIDISKPIYLYHFDPVKNSVDKVGDALTAYKKGEMYYVDITITHCSDYFLSLNGNIVTNTNTNPSNNQNTNTNTGTGTNTNTSTNTSTSTNTNTNTSTNTSASTNNSQNNSTTVKTMPKTGSVIDDEVLSILGALLVLTGFIVITRKKRKKTE